MVVMTTNVDNVDGDDDDVVFLMETHHFNWWQKRERDSMWKWDRFNFLYTNPSTCFAWNSYKNNRNGCEIWANRFRLDIHIFSALSTNQHQRINFQWRRQTPLSLDKSRKHTREYVERFSIWGSLCARHQVSTIARPLLKPSLSLSSFSLYFIRSHLHSSPVLKDDCVR